MNQNNFFTAGNLCYDDYLFLSQTNFEKDTIKTSKGNLEITFIGHGSLMFTYDDKVILIDPYSKLADYSQFPKADLILYYSSSWRSLGSFCN